MKNRGYCKRIDKELHEMIKKRQEEMDESYRAASKMLARDLKEIKLKAKKIKNDITF